MKTNNGRILASMLTLLAFAGAAQAHQEWTRGNNVTANTIALYHFDDEIDGLPVPPVDAASPLPDDRDLPFGASVGAGVEIDHEVAFDFFGPHALKFNSAQSASTVATFPSAGDVTIEFWLKWDADLTSSSIEIGWASSAKLRITRDTANPANDQFGISATHGDYRAAPGFTSFKDLDTSGTQLGKWRHYALAIHSTGQVYNPVSAHDEYTTGSVARLLNNGHPVSEPADLDITGVKAHDLSKITIRNIAGSVSIDEVTIWNSDLTENGAVVNPYADGRGEGISFGTGDLDGDGFTGLGDFLLLIDNWQTTYYGQFIDLSIFLNLIDHWQTGV